MANNLVTATCPNCNSPLQIKEGQDFVKCEYCGTISKRTEGDRVPPAPKHQL